MNEHLEQCDNLVKELQQQILRGKESFNWRELNQLLTAYADIRTFALECQTEADRVNKRLLELEKSSEKTAEGTHEYDTVTHRRKWSTGVAMD